jgi:multiple antibiotic resistance protein
MTIDAGVISVAITVGANHAHSFKHAMIQLLAAVIGAGIIALSILLTYRYAQRVGKRIGNTGMMVVVRLSAFIMLCIGVGHQLGTASRRCWQKSAFWHSLSSDGCRRRLDLRC